ncbi:MAG TPA: TolC family protein [Sphingobacteriaceae bacterium]
MNKRRLATVGFALGIQLMTSGAYSQTKKWSLDECLHYAEEHNLTLKRMENEVKLADASRTRAWGQLLPSVSAFASNDYNRGFGINPITNSYENLTTRSNTFSAGISVPLFAGGANIAAVRMASLESIAKAYERDQLGKDIKINIMVVYLQILQAKENLTVAGNQVQLAANLVEQIRIKVTEGAAAPAQQAELEAALASDKKKRVEAQTALEIAKLQLIQLLQLQDPVLEISQDSISEPVLAEEARSATDIFNSAVSRFSSVRQHETLLRSADKAVAIAKARRYPSLSLDASTGSRLSNISPNPYRDQFKSNLGHYVGVSMQIPIFTRFNTVTGVRTAKIEADQQRNRLEEEKNKLWQAILKARTDVELAKAGYIAASESARSQEIAFRYATEKWNAGLITVYDFNQSRNRLAEERLRLVQAKFDLAFRARILKYFETNDIPG